MTPAERMARVVELQDRLVELHQQAGETLRKLQRALQMQAVWPDAFAEGHACGYCEWTRGLRRKQAVTRAWLQRADGVKHYLSRDEALLFNPDAIIHPDFTEEGP